MSDCPHGYEKRTCEFCELTAERTAMQAVEEERNRLQRIIADIFVALYPPSPGDGTVRTIEHTEMPAHVRQVVEERNRLRAETDGWRSENDRHRSLYVDAVKERDRLRTVADAARKIVGACRDTIEEVRTDGYLRDAILGNVVMALTKVHGQLDVGAEAADE